MPSAELISAVQHLWYGHGNVPSRNDYEYSWKAVKVVAAGDGVLSPPERLHLVGKMCAILTPPDIVENVLSFDEQSATPEALLARIQVPDEVRPGVGAWIVYEGLSVALADGELAPGEMESIHRAAAAMGLAPATVEALAGFCHEEAGVRARRIRLLNATIPTQFRFAHSAGEATPGGQPLSAQP